jgi:hypothetical protein
MGSSGVVRSEAVREETVRAKVGRCEAVRWRAHGKEKAAPGSGLFIYYPLLSEYQEWGVSLPNFFGVIGL